MLNEAGCAVGLYCAETILSSPGHFGALHFILLAYCSACVYLCTVTS
jgi:hypothetical protein